MSQSWVTARAQNYVKCRCSGCSSEVITFCQSTTLDPSLNMTVEMSIEGDKLVVGSLRGRFNLYGFRQTGNHFIKVHV